MLCSTASAQLKCPPCYYNQAPLPGHGAAPDGSKRRVITLKADTVSWGSPPPANISAGTQKAADKWNQVTTCYYFSVITSGTPDFLVTSNTSPQGGCADNKINSYPYTIELLNAVQHTNYSSDLIGSLIAHEIGHGIGLDNADNGCLYRASIMQGYTGTACQQVTPAPTAADVSKSNQNCTSQGTCDRSVPIGPIGIPETTSCPRAATCPNEGKAYLLDGPSDPCLWPDIANWCPNSGDVVFSNCCYQNESPIIVDLQHSGFRLTDAADGVYFDFSGDGVPKLVSWLATNSGDAWLALDRNHNGKIDSGRELFGNYTAQPASPNPNGFAALAEFDKPINGGNGDGVIDARDAVFGRLLLWTDDNHNGVSEPEELHSLQEFGILAIDLRYTFSSWRDLYGNLFRFKGRVLREQKWEDRTIYDVLLLTNQ
ncbi:MAG: hypothetical protein JO270_01520 [Acidobacteriaceae bacterium]|nr:hypothetical protein [Acidobacteriaceae bacterium]